MRTQKKRLLQAQSFMERYFPGESPHIIERSKERAEKSGAMFRAVVPGIPLDFAGPYLYSIHNLKNQTVYWGISWKCADGHCLAGTTLLDDLYTGSPDQSEYSVMREKQKPHDFMMVIWAIFPTPEGYADLEKQDKDKWLEDNLGEAEKHVIKRSREAIGDYAEGGLTLNVGSGGVNGGGGFAGKTHSEEARERISKATSGKNNPMYGKTPSEETRAKMSKAQSGRTHSDETKAKISKARLGKTHSQETREKMSKSTSGENHPRFGKFGADNPLSKPVIELVSGITYAGGHEAARETGVGTSTISINCIRSRDKLKQGKQLTASSRRTSNDGLPNKNLDKCWMLYSDFLKEINAGNSVEVHKKL